MSTIIKATFLSVIAATFGQAGCIALAIAALFWVFFYILLQHFKAFLYDLKQKN